MKIWSGMELDVVGIRRFKTVPPKVAIIEVKMNDWESVKYQCLKRLSMADEVYMGLVMRGNVAYFMYKLGKDIDFLERQNIGLLIWDVARKAMFKVLSAKNQQYARKIQVIDTFKEELVKGMNNGP